MPAVRQTHLSASRAAPAALPVLLQSRRTPRSPGTRSGDVTDLDLPPGPGNVHYLSPENPVRVTHSMSYRLSWADIVERSDPQWEPLTTAFPEPYRPAGTFAAAGLESQEHSILWLGSAEVITRFRDDPAHPVPWAEFAGQGIRADQWPCSGAWLDRIPPTTWCPGGQGIVTEHDFDGAKVIVYELPGTPALLSGGTRNQPQGLVPVVTFHCTRCHMEGTRDDRYTSASPSDRRMAGLRARKHMRPGRCRGAEATAWGDKMTAAAEHAIRGVPQPGDLSGLYAFRCLVSQLRPDVISGSTCAEVREARDRAVGAGQPGGPSQPEPGR
jgi:hypothetical protein